MELKIIIKDRSIDGLKLALEAIMQNISQANRKAVDTPHGYWKYMISGGGNETNKDFVRPKR